MLHFWLSVLIKAVQDSLNFIGQSTTGVCYAVLVLLLTIIWLTRKHGGVRQAFKQHWRPAGEGLVIAAVAFLLVVMVHLLYEPFHLVDDERARKQQAIGQKDHAEDQMQKCQADLGIEQARSELLGRQVTAQQTFVTNQQSAATTQQSTINTCVAVLAKGLEPVPLTIRVSENAFTTNQKDAAGKEIKYWVLVVSTNKEVSPFQGTLHCDPRTVVFQGRVTFPTDNDFSELIVGPERTPDGGFRISYTNPPVWQPNDPLVFIAVQVDRPTGCKFVVG